MDCSNARFSCPSPSPRVAQIHVHWVGDDIPPSCPLSSFLLLPSIFPTIRVFSNDSALHIRWPKYWSFSFSISPSNEYSGVIPFRINWFDLLVVWRTLKEFYRFSAIVKKLPMAFFLREIEQKFYMEIQKTSNKENNLEKQHWSWRNQCPWFQTILQSSSHQNFMVLEQNQKYRWMEQGRKPTYKPTHLWSINLCHRRQEYKMKER